MKPYFTDPLTITKITRTLWRVEVSFDYYSKGGDVINIPKGFVTDLASIPRPFWSFIGPPAGGRYAQSAVVHDFLYTTQEFTRLKTDRLFYEGMEVLGTPRWRRTLMFAAVRLGGWAPWENYQKKKKNT